MCIYIWGIGMGIVVATHGLRQWNGIGILRMVQGTEARYQEKDKNTIWHCVQYDRGTNRRQSNIRSMRPLDEHRPLDEQFVGNVRCI